MRTMFMQRFHAWFLQSWKGFFVVGSIVLMDEFLREGYLFKMSDILVFRLTHEKFVVGAFLLRVMGPLFIKKNRV